MPMLDITGTRVQPLQKSFTAVDVTLENANDLAMGQSDAAIIENDADLDALSLDFSALGAIVLTFPSFADGRAYSQASLLRDRYKFRGQIIARGDVLPDQVGLMKRCGISAIETDRNDIDVFTAGLNRYSHVYQHAADDNDPVWQLRGARKRAAA